MTSQPTPDEPVTAATVAAWRRRREADEALPPPPGGSEWPANGTQVTAVAVTLPDVTGPVAPASLGIFGPASPDLLDVTGPASADPPDISGPAFPGPLDVTGPASLDPPDVTGPVTPRLPGVTGGSVGGTDTATEIYFADASAFSPPRDALADRLSGLTEPAGDQRQAAGLAALLSQGGLAEPAAPAAAGVAGPTRRRFPVPLPLLIILTTQAALAASLIRANTAFQDEALYLWAGHLEIAHLLHGTPVPPFAAYFSGAPVIYPPIGALADSIGGLAGARLLSLCFMLGATTLLWSVTSRLYGRRAAFFAAGIWALLGPVLHLSALATFDAMSLFLVALAVWCATGASRRHDATGWILAAAGSLALANAAKYASVIFDPAVIGMAWLSACPQPGGKVAARRATLLATCLTGLLALIYRLGGGYYAVGVRQTTLARIVGKAGAAQVLGAAWPWVGLVAVLAAAGAVIGVRSRIALSSKLMLVLLAGTALLVPLAQARLHTTTSLDKHVAFGVWFAVIAGGYALSFLTTAIRPHVLRTSASVACGVGLALLAALGLTQARALSGWPNTSALVAALRPLTGGSTGHLLVETPSVPEYYLPAGAQWERWSNTWSVLLPGGQAVGSQGVGEAGVPSVYAQLITAHYFSVVALNFDATPVLDRQIAALLKRTPGYRMVKRVPYGRTGSYVIWVDESHAAAG